jgi:internalin A
LKELNVYRNAFSDVAPLTRLTNLTSLDLRWNTLTNPSVLSSLSNFGHLSQLFLAGTALTNIDFVQPLTQLTSLNLGENSITNLSPLLPLTNLQYLTLSWNNSLTNDAYTNLSAMPGLVSLELRGDGLTSVGFLSSLGHLTYADLAFNDLSDLSPLAGINNLSLVLDANTNLDYNKLSSMTNIARIWLNGCSLTNVGFLHTMTQLKGLGLEQNSITDASPLIGLTNLTLLGLSQCSFANYDWVTALPRLEGLRLDGNSLSNYPAVSSLSFLSLNKNRLTDLSALTSLTNLSSAYLTYNRICDISTLANLPKLRFLDAGHNLDSIAPAQSTANLMRGHWVTSASASLSYLPMDQLNMSLVPPMSPTWYIPARRTRSFNVYVNDLVVPAPELSITASSLPLVDVPLTLTNSIIGTNAYRTIMVTPTAGQTGTVTNVLVAHDSLCGLINSLNITTYVMAEDDNFLVPSLQLSNALWSASQPADGLTSVDLLNLTSFSATGLGLTNIGGLQWGSNLDTLNLSGNALRDISPLAGLTNLTSLALDSNPLTNTAVLGSLTGLRFLSLRGVSNMDITFLTGLTNLQSLDLSSSLVTNFNAFTGLTSLTTLNLSDNVVTNISFLTNLPGLVSLDISSDKLADISPLRALTNLSALYLQQNRLTDISVLTNLHHLSYLNVQLNLLGPNAYGSLPILQNQVANLVYPPQRSAPFIDVRTNWLIVAGTNLLSFTLSDTGPEDEILNTSAISTNTSLTCTNRFSGVDNTWTLIAFAQPPAVGTNYITLSATNDVGLSTNVTITVEVIANLNSNFSQLSATNLAWTTSGDKSWLMQNFVTFQGQPSAQSGGIGNSQNSVLQLTNLVGPGRLSFWWRVSSESNFDWFEFDLGSQTNRISGEVGWQRQVYPVPAGLQTAQWRYYKDANTSAGLDAGFLAQVTFEPGIWLEMTRRPTNGNARTVLSLHGVPGLLYEVQVSTNLSHSPGKTNWFPLAPSIVATNISMRYTDTNANSAVRLYRLHSLGEPSMWLELAGRPSNGQCTLTLHTFPGLPYEVLAATNLSSPTGITSWFSLTPSIVPTNSSVSFTDTTANSSVRFYRLHSTIQP